MMATTTHLGLKLLEDGSDVTAFPSTDRFNMNKLDDEVYSAANGLNTLKLTAIAQNTDLNSLTEPGFYGCSSAAIAGTLINAPSGLSMNFTMIVTKKSSSLAAQQINAGRHIYIRNQSSTGWSDWYDHGSLYDGLDMANAGYALDAKQGYVLKGLVDAKPDRQGGFGVASGATATVKLNSSFRGLLLAFGVQSGLCGAWMLATNEAASSVGIAVELIRGSSIELTGTNATKTFTNNGSYTVTLYTLCFNGDCTVTVNS